MNFVSKSLHHSNIVFLVPPDQLKAVDPQQVFNLFPVEVLRGSTFVDDPVMHLKVFGFPANQITVVIEENRLRLEDDSGKNPEETKKGLEAYRILKTLFPNIKPQSWGFNYDIMYRADQVIPQREILKNFVADQDMENVRDFGWQFTLKDPKQNRQRTYFFKVVSPLEVALHMNDHFLDVPFGSADDLQSLYESSFKQADQILNQLTF